MASRDDKEWISFMKKAGMDDGAAMEKFRRNRISQKQKVVVVKKVNGAAAVQNMKRQGLAPNVFHRRVGSRVEMLNFMNGKENKTGRKGTQKKGTQKKGTQKKGTQKKTSEGGTLHVLAELEEWKRSKALNPASDWRKEMKIAKASAESAAKTLADSKAKANLEKKMKELALQRRKKSPPPSLPK